jgi:NIMA (never in mitosis gene a)-related kinase
VGLEYIHRNKILHRDIKTLNIFMNKGEELKIGDLGVAKMLTSNEFAQTMVGTPFYLSPELCEEKPYNEKSDVWALGCLLYELCTYRHPFEAQNQASLILKIIRGKYSPPRA